MPEPPIETDLRSRAAIGQAIIRACMHPAMHRPMHYALDYSRSFLLLILLSLAILAVWSTYISNPIHALAPRETTVLVELVGR